MTTSDDGADATSGAGSTSGPDAASGSDVSEPTQPVVPRPLQFACGVIALQALAFVGVAGYVFVDTALGNASHALRALLGGVFALLGAVVLLVAARNLLRLVSAARTPVVVLQLLALPVSYTMVQAGLVGYGGPIAVSALVVLYLLFTPPVRAVLDRDISV